MAKNLLSLAILFLISTFSFAQEIQSKGGTLKGQIKDQNSGETLIGATVAIVGTYQVISTDLDGNFVLKNITPGDYSIRISYVGYSDKQINGIKIRGGETKELNTTMTETSNNLGEVVIEGAKNLVDLEDAKSKFKLVAEDIKEMNARDVVQLAAMQPGVNSNVDGIQIRGGRTYETSYVVDGVSASDPLAGTGFGVGLNSGSIQELSITTGGAGAEYGDAVSGVVAAKIKEGSNRWSASGNWITDDFGVRGRSPIGWSTDILNAQIGGPIIKDKLTFFTSVDMNISDGYTSIPKGGPAEKDRFIANQVRTSLLDDSYAENPNLSKIFAPRQDNRWSNTIKVAYTIRKGMKITLTNQHSLIINQDRRTLQIVGFDQIAAPGFQYDFGNNLDNASTYAHETNLSALNYKWLFAKNWSYDLTIGRLTTNMRADANGRPFRYETVDRQLDPNSIVTGEVTVYNPNEPNPFNGIYVNPGSGLINNNGIARLWHDHYVEQYEFNHKVTKATFNRRHFFSFGWQHKEQSYHWVDVSSPWVGQSLKLPDGTFTQPTSLGSSSDYWGAPSNPVRPASGGFFATDEIRYKGIIATIGLRYNYWTHGTFLDNAVGDSTLVSPASKDEYLNRTTDLGGRRFAGRLLPSINVSFPITDNNVLFFNYGHSMRIYPHPLYVYQGLESKFANRSFQSEVGNPGLKPETTVSYELGIKSQITANTGLTFTAFYSDKFDYAVTRSIELKDRTGQTVSRQIYINSDYSRTRGIEATLSQRFTQSLRGNVSLTYQSATGKSNSAAEARQNIKNDGFVGASKEQYLIWDVPFQAKVAVIFTPDSLWKIGEFSLKGFRVFFTSTFKSNQLRYTPATSNGTFVDGREQFLVDNQRKNELLSAPIFYSDLVLSRDFMVSKKVKVSVSVECKNIFNNENSQIINNVTGRAYYYGDALNNDVRDPVYPNPQFDGIPPYNPARFMQPRQLLFGLSLSY
ncbi:MAG: TonB-dependent receptor [Cytophagales bacterium]